MYSDQKEKTRVNVRLLLDGVEEQESPFLMEIVRSHYREPEADLVISAPCEAHQSVLITIAFGVCGILIIDLTLHTANTGMPAATLETLRQMLHFKRFTC